MSVSPETLEGPVEPKVGDTMPSLTTVYFALSLAITPPVFLAAPASHSSFAAPSVDQSPPAEPLLGTEKSQAKIRFSSSDIFGNVDYFMEEKSVWINWVVTFNPGSPSDPHFSLQREATTFWPTEVSSAGPGRLAVAGKSVRSGDTVIEIWAFELPDPFPSPVVDQVTGETVYPSIHVPIVSKRVVYDESTQGRGLVRFMFEQQGKESHLFVQFWDSRDLYSFDYATEGIAVALSATQVEGVPHEPALSNDYVDRWSAKHSSHGCVYFFSPLDDKTLDLLAVFDENCDGRIDDHYLMSRSRFGQMGLGDGESYEERY